MFKVIIIFMFFVIPTQSFSAENYVFGKVKWTMSIEEINKILETNPSETNISNNNIIYVYNNLKIGNIETKLVVEFKNNKLESVGMNIRNSSSYIKLRDILTARFGQPVSSRRFMESGSSIIWHDENTIAELVQRH